MGMFHSRSAPVPEVPEVVEAVPIEDVAEEEAAAIVIVDGVIGEAEILVNAFAPVEPEPIPAPSDDSSIQNGGLQVDNQSISGDNQSISGNDKRAAVADCNENDGVVNVSGYMRVENGEAVLMEPIANDVEHSQAQNNDVAPNSDPSDGAHQADVETTVRVAIKRSAHDEEKAQDLAESPRKKSNIEEPTPSDTDNGEVEGCIVEPNNANEDDADEMS